MLNPHTVPFNNNPFRKNTFEILKIKTMKDFIPLFPLSLVVFPGEHLNLHIFEPRYRQLIRECEENKITFGIPAYIDNNLMDFGTEVRLKKITNIDADGKMDVETEGIGIFKIHTFYREVPNKLYGGADIERMTDTSKGNSHTSHRILMAARELFDLLSIEKSLPEDADDFSVYDLAHHVGFSLSQEYDFLCIPTEMERQNFMLTHLEELIPIVKETEKLRKKASMNGHFKRVISPDS